MKLLTVGLVLVTAAVAGCSSTTGSSGAVQNDVTANPMPSPEFSPSAGTSAGPVASASPTLPPIVSCTNEAATRSDSSSSPPSPAEPIVGGFCHPPAPKIVACDPGMQYACGGYGQSGVGTVFYASTASFACGANMASTCNYLEMAPNMWNPNFSSACRTFNDTSCDGTLQTTSDFSSTGKGFPWCTGSGGTSSISGTTNQVIGSGFTNTTAMLPVCNSDDAGNVARSYTGGGMTDWSLSSENELNALYWYSGRAGVGGFNSGGYWSSSQGSCCIAHYQTFVKGDQGSDYTKYAYGVRPIRAF